REAASCPAAPVDIVVQPRPGRGSPPSNTRTQRREYCSPEVSPGFPWAWPWPWPALPVSRIGARTRKTATATPTERNQPKPGKTSDGRYRRPVVGTFALPRCQDGAKGRKDHGWQAEGGPDVRDLPEGQGRSPRDGDPGHRQGGQGREEPPANRRRER